jgi:uncharacterized OsmC-like protein
MRIGDSLSEQPLTKVTLIQGFKFRVKFDVDGMPDLVVDEMKPIGENSGPNPTRLLSAAIGHCLSSSLLFCLQKARIDVSYLETAVKANIERNSEGRLRITRLDAQIHLNVKEEDKNRVSRCLDIFEDYCTVTQSVINGLQVNLTIK